MINECEFIGHIGKVPEYYTFPSGDKKVTLSLATTKKWTDKQSGERKERTTWVPLIATGPVVSVIERFVTKGTLLRVLTEYQSRSFDGSDGKKVYVSEFKIDKLTLLGGGAKSGESTTPAVPQSDSGTTDPLVDDEIPF